MESKIISNFISYYFYKSIILDERNNKLSIMKNDW